MTLRPMIVKVGGRHLGDTADSSRLGSGFIGGARTARGVASSRMFDLFLMVASVASEIAHAFLGSHGDLRPLTHLEGPVAVAYFGGHRAGGALLKYRRS